MLDATHTTACRLSSMQSSTSPTPSSRSGWPHMLGFSKEQIAAGLLVPVIGNTYAGAAIIGLTAILDIAQPGDRILMVSFGSGAGSDAFAHRRHRCHQRAPGPRPAHPGLHRPPHARSITPPMPAMRGKLVMK